MKIEEILSLNNKTIVVNSIANYYGTLVISKKENKYYWTIGLFNHYDASAWTSISKSLFEELAKHAYSNTD